MFRLIAVILFGQVWSLAANFYVRENGTGAGASWDDALPGDQLARLLPKLVDDDSVFVAKGRYLPENSDATGRDKTFLIRANIAMVGGFPVDAQGQDRTVRDISGYLTILDGDLGVANDYSDDAYHVVVVAADRSVGKRVLLDGFRVVNGNASGSTYNTALHDRAFRGFAGGAFVGSPAEFRYVNFVNNQAKELGGALFVADTLFMEHSLLSANAGKGGAIASEAPWWISSTTFIHNVGVSEPGGALSMRGTGYTGTLLNCVFDNNEAPYGGAIGSLGPGLTVTNTLFHDNRATEYGGAILSVSGDVHISGSLFEENQGGSLGGALYVSGTPALAVTIKDCRFVHNEADLGGALASAGGRFLVSASEFRRNHAKDYGGAIYTEGALEVNHSELDSNSAENVGGAIYSLSPRLFLRSSSLDSNSVGANVGGALYWVGDSCAIDSTRFQANFAASMGGAASLNGSYKITVSRFVGNSTIGSGLTHGGALSVLGDGIIGYSEFSDNHCKLGAWGHGGGAIYHGQGTLNLLFSTLEGNSCAAGGALYGDSVQIIATTIVGNQASQANGAWANSHPEGSLILSSLILDNEDGSSTGSDLQAVRGWSNLFTEKDTLVFALYKTAPWGASVPVLADNGGATRTVALNPLGPAVLWGLYLGSFIRNDTLRFAFYTGIAWQDENTNSHWVNETVTPLNTDQRGVGFGLVASIGAFYMPKPPLPEAVTIPARGRWIDQRFHGVWNLLGKRMSATDTKFYFEGVNRMKSGDVH